LRLSPSQFYKLHRYDGQLLYIKATFFGTLSAAFAYILDSYLGVVSIVSQILPRNGLSLLYETEHLQECLIFVLFSGLLSILYSFWDRLRLILKAMWLLKRIKIKSSYRLAKILLMHSILNDSPLDVLLFKSYAEEKFLLITMSNRKVYVGRVIGLGEPNEKQGPDQEISIVPVFSGYRDKDTMSVILNHSYDSRRVETAGNILFFS